MGIDNQEKINIINNIIDNLDIHISILEQDILLNPDLDIEGKPKRSSILQDLYYKKQSLHNEKDSLA